MKRIGVVCLLIGGLPATAAAQSSTTLYGLLDLSVVQTSGNGQRALRMLDGTAYGPGSRWGLRVNEDLGGGMRAGVLLEAGILADTGNAAQGGRAFGRQAYVWVNSVKAGDLRLGRQIMFHDETVFVANTTLGGTVLSPGGIFTVKSGVFNPMLSAPRISNAVQYLTPIVSGFRGQFMVAPGEQTQDRYHGIKATYASGRLATAVAYESSKPLNAVPGQPSVVNRIAAAGANYDFGVLRLFGGVERAKDLTTGIGTQIGTLTLPGLTGPATRFNAHTVGASMPVGATILMVNHVRTRFSDGSGHSASVARYGAGATHWLSKRTAVYGVVAMAAGDMKHSVNEKRAYQLGLRHTF